MSDEEDLNISDQYQSDDYESELEDSFESLEHDDENTEFVELDDSFTEWYKNVLFVSNLNKLCSFWKLHLFCLIILAKSQSVLSVKQTIDPGLPKKVS